MSQAASPPLTVQVRRLWRGVRAGQRNLAVVATAVVVLLVADLVTVGGWSSSAAKNGTVASGGPQANLAAGGRGGTKTPGGATGTPAQGGSTSSGDGTTAFGPGGGGSGTVSS